MNATDEKDNLEVIAKRMFEFVELQGISNADFASILDIGAARLSHIKNGRNNVSLEICAKILESFPKLNPDWLLLGQGAMFRGQKQEPTANNAQQTDLFNNSKIVFDTEKEPVQQETTQMQQVLTTASTANMANAVRKVEKIILFYDDNSFQELTP